MNKYFIISFLLLVGILIGCSYSKVKMKNEYIDGVKVMNITENKGVYSYPTWSPDGKKLAYNFDGNVWLMEIGYKGNAITTNSKGLGRPIIWNNDEIIYYLNSNAFKEFGENHELHQIRLSENKDTILFDALPIISRISINPNNSKEFVFGSRPFHEETNNIYILNLENSTFEKIITNGFAPRWSPNGKLIVYDGPDGIYMYNVMTGKTQNIYSYLNDEIVDHFTWSPDSQWVAYRVTSSTIQGIYIIAADGSTIPELIINTDVSNLDWSPNGDKIAFTSINAPYSNEIYIMDVPDKFKSKE